MAKPEQREVASTNTFLFVFSVSDGHESKLWGLMVSVHLWDAVSARHNWLSTRHVKAFGAVADGLWLLGRWLGFCVSLQPGPALKQAVHSTCKSGIVQAMMTCACTQVDQLVKRVLPTTEEEALRAFECHQAADRLQAMPSESRAVQGSNRSARSPARR